MNEFWCALALALISPDYCTPERAFEILNTGVRSKDMRSVTTADVVDMVEMKETMTYRQIGNIYGMKADAVYNRIRRFKGII